ncbi:putative enoyl-CoA hydratase echA6 [mine drainage metagenome]|uniref:Putative enoyl-CoA hydratase echA6 n=1 Tax=mine drainage metagenome TaxID=410659 RepID=A0A1J5RLJ8_9ZZZZ
MTAPILITRDASVARVTLARPAVRNAFDAETIAALHAAFVELPGDGALRAIVLDAQGPAFCAGADLNYMRAMAGWDDATNRDDAMRLARMLRAIAECPLPVIARVHGDAFAGGVGERLHAVELPEWDLLVGWPGRGLSTAAMFADASLRRDTPALRVDDFVATQRAAGDAPALSYGRNDLQPVAQARLPELAALYDWLAAHGSGTPRMSGSGSALFVPGRVEFDVDELPADWRLRGCRALREHPLLGWADGADATV